MVTIKNFYIKDQSSYYFSTDYPQKFLNHIDFNTNIDDIDFNGLDNFDKTNAMFEKIYNDFLKVNGKIISEYCNIPIDNLYISLSVEYNDCNVLIEPHEMIGLSICSINVKCNNDNVIEYFNNLNPHSIVCPYQFILYYSGYNEGLKEKFDKIAEDYINKVIIKETADKFKMNPKDIKLKDFYWDLLRK